MRRGIILAGGMGTRLYPATRAVCKQLMPVYDKPMIYYPLSVLMLAGIREILIITTQRDCHSFQDLLGDGSQFGLFLSYATQPRPDGLAQAYLVGRHFVEGHPSAVILGDNIFFGQGLDTLLAKADARKEGATVFAYYVSNPEAYGVISFDEKGATKAIEEKPEKPKSNYAVTGLYFYDEKAVEYAQAIRPSARGEHEITDLNRAYLNAGNLHAVIMGRGFAWLDTGTHASFVDASLYVKVLEERQGIKICCPEEIAWRKGYISDEQLERLAEPMCNSGYGEYLRRVLCRGIIRGFS
ncbi:MAG: glucose-1-phosphate thymidylyltransferase RfbA [Rhizomicrobium sp.]